VRQWVHVNEGEGGATTFDGKMGKVKGGGVERRAGSLRRKENKGAYERFVRSLIFFLSWTVLAVSKPWYAVQIGDTMVTSSEVVKA